jgi:hypothetical protein
MVTRMANIKKEGVKSVCVNHGIEFQDILNVIPNGLTRLFGPLQEKVSPSTSRYDTAQKDSASHLAVI